MYTAIKITIKTNSVTNSFLKQFCLFCLIFISLGCTSFDAQKNTNSLSQKGFQVLFGPGHPITYIAKHNNTGSVIGIEVKFKKSNPDQHYVFEIQFSAPGTVLKEKEYKKHYQASVVKKSAEQHKMYFPSIGLRAQYSFLGAGPGGVAEQLAFTSTNKSHDVKIVASHLLPNGMEPLAIMLPDIANFINKALLQG